MSRPRPCLFPLPFLPVFHLLPKRFHSDELYFFLPGLRLSPSRRDFRARQTHQAFELPEMSDLPELPELPEFPEAHFSAYFQAAFAFAVQPQASFPGHFQARFLDFLLSCTGMIAVTCSDTGAVSSYSESVERSVSL